MVAKAFSGEKAASSATTPREKGMKLPKSFQSSSGQHVGDAQMQQPLFKNNLDPTSHTLDTVEGLRFRVWDLGFEV